MTIAPISSPDLDAAGASGFAVPCCVECTARVGHGPVPKGRLTQNGGPRLCSTVARRMRWTFAGRNAIFGRYGPQPGNIAAIPLATGGLTPGRILAGRDRAVALRLPARSVR